MRAIHTRIFVACAVIAAPTARAIMSAAPAHAATHGLLARGSIVGDAREDVGALEDAGVVYVFPPDDNASGLTSVGSIAITEATLGIAPHSSDMFGASVLQADTNGDGMPDLIIGAPGRNTGSGAGCVNAGPLPKPADVVPGEVAFSNGFTPRSVDDRAAFRPGSRWRAGTAELGDEMGAGLPPD